MTLSLTACGGTNRKVTSASTSNTTVQSTPSAEDESKTTEDPLGFNVTFSKTYRNDKTGNWRLAEITENIDIEEYAVEYYKNYFKDDKEFHIIVKLPFGWAGRNRDFTEKIIAKDSYIQKRTGGIRFVKIKL